MLVYKVKANGLLFFLLCPPSAYLHSLRHMDFDIRITTNKNKTIMNWVTYFIFVYEKNKMKINTMNYGYIFFT